MASNKCALCPVALKEMNAFLEHFQNEHPTENIQILVPGHRRQHGKRKYMCMNYHTTMEEIGNKVLTFADDLALVEVSPTNVAFIRWDYRKHVFT